MLTLPQVSRATIDVPTIDWSTRSRRYVHPGELELVCGLINSVDARNVLEFGCNVGRTAQAVLEYCPTVVHYEGIDVPMGYVTAKEVQRKEVPDAPGHLANDDPRFRMFLPARGSLDLMASDLSRCDAAFIDGDHGYASVQHDTDLALSLARPGGIIIWHDYHDLRTVDVADVLHERHAAGLVLFHIEGTWLVYHRVPG